MENEYKQKTDIERIERLANLMDARFYFPGTKFKFGIDPILGLLPVVGDIISFGISSLLILTMTKHGVSRKVVIMMILNISIDAILSGIPIIGNIFDFFYKANLKNVKLLKKHYGEGKYQGRGNDLLFLIVIALILIISLIVFGIIQLLSFILGLF